MKTRILQGLLLLCLCLAVVGLSRPGAVETAQWGLHFEKAGQVPTGRESMEKLRENNAYFAKDTQEKVLFLTFDLGYENGRMPAILDCLEEKGVPATFFVTGHYLDSQPDLVRRMVAQGHTVANHTVHHPDMAAVPEDTFRQELAALEEKFVEITGQQMPKIFRPPQGSYNAQCLKLAQKYGYQTVFWSVAYADWDNKSQPDPQKSVELLCKRIHPGAVVLLHGTSQTNAQILPQLIDRWQKMGYRIAPITELFQN